MQKLIFMVFICLGMAACQTTTPHLGEAFEVKNTISVDSFVKKIGTESSLKDLQIEGTIAKSCMSEGCWFTIKDVSGKEVLFNVKDKKFKVPINSPDKKAVILADATSESTDGQPFTISVRGMMFK